MSVMRGSLVPEDTPGGGLTMVVELPVEQSVDRVITAQTTPPTTPRTTPSATAPAGTAASPDDATTPVAPSARQETP